MPMISDGLTDSSTGKGVGIGILISENNIVKANVIRDSSSAVDVSGFIINLSTNIIINPPVDEIN